MGCELMRHCPFFRDSLKKCGKALTDLPDGPSWCLTSALAAGPAFEGIFPAEFSQPLCTAIQVALIDLLKAAGVRFSAVVGHSSGEIAAAYAAGVLNRRDAMGIAYYRGSVAHLAEGSSGQKGAMMAVGVSFEDAITFCCQPKYKGRLAVAASNSPSTVTLSGDIDAIHQAKESFHRKTVFAKILHVDVAYHSHHMSRCAEAYARCLAHLGIQLKAPQTHCVWYSSVHEHMDLLQEPLDHLLGQYWVDNMVKSVLFCQAIGSALKLCQPFELILEVGPHPALKAPIKQICDSFADAPIPYTGCLQRGKDDVECMSDMIGFLWSHISSPSVDFDGWRKAFCRPIRPRLLKSLPSYAWDHDRIHWHESRLSKQFRSEEHRPHELLGRLHENHKHEMTWRNIFGQNDMPWIKGHMFQGQVVFPGAGYVSMALEAARLFVRNRSVDVFEIRDMSIPKALVIPGNDDQIEILFRLRKAERNSAFTQDSMLEAEFTCYSGPAGGNLDKTCEGRILIHASQSSYIQFPPSISHKDELPPLSIERFFKTLASTGITYDGVFQALSSINRIWGIAEASARWAKGDLTDDYVLHPAILDVSFQAGFSTFASVAADTMGSAYLPSSIQRILVVPAGDLMNSGNGVSVDIQAQLTRSTSSQFEVDIEVFESSSKALGVQIDGLVLKAISEPLPSDDRLIFAKRVSDVDASCVLPDPPLEEEMRDEVDYIDAVERTALFFLQRLSCSIPLEDRDKLKTHHKALLRGIDILLNPIRDGRHNTAKVEWLDDTREMIHELNNRFPNSVDLALLTAVGEGLPSVIRGESEMLEHMLKDNLLGRLYSEGRGFSACNQYMAHIMRKVTHKYPRARILEIGAGTGGTTDSVLNAISGAYLSYTYTDISAGFFEKAAERFADHIHKMEFKTLNIENPPDSQGFTRASYDIIIAANVLHATRTLQQTMKHVRSLLRPGGYLLAIEVTGNMLRELGLMGGLEGWWLGIEDGRFPTPGISARDWDRVLLDTGFSGVESITYDFVDISRHNCSVFFTKALDEKFALLSDPLSGEIPMLEQPAILIIGGLTLPVAKAARRAKSLFRRWTQRVSICESIEALRPSEIGYRSSVLCLTELDSAIFSQGLSDSMLRSLQELLGNAAHVVWVTSMGQDQDPHSNMMLGIGRSLAFELPHLTMQFLDFDQHSSWDMELAVSSLLRMVLLSSPDYATHDMVWAQEPELVVKNNTVWIPRLVPDDDSNKRLNAKRRRVSEVVTSSDRIEVSDDSAHAIVIKKGPRVGAHDTLEMDVNLSLALHAGDEPATYLCYGKLRGIDERTYAISKTNASVITVRAEDVLQPTAPYEGDATTLVSVASTLIAFQILDKSPRTGTIIVHNPTVGIAEAISNLAASTQRSVLFSGSTPSNIYPGWISIHHLDRVKRISQLIPQDSSVFWCLSDDIEMEVTRCLPKSCVFQRLDLGNLTHQRAKLLAAHELAGALTSQMNPSVISIADLNTFQPRNERFAMILGWSWKGPLSATVDPINVDQVFSADRTYFLVGMTNELGQSLCRFLVGHGVRYIVLASRNPSTSAKWAESISMLGVDVRVVTMDVTNKAQIQETVSMIRSTMPPIAGVANGSLVLQDSLFVNTTVEAIGKQLKPKVNGTAYLDEQFSQDHLDFFIAFSSLGSIYGNAGQSIYHAANMFMTSLVEKRRARGQSASVLHLGMIVDVGYVAKAVRAQENIEQHLLSEFYTPLAESEFHQSFIQAVLSGRTYSTHGDVTTGIQPFFDDADASARPHWYTNPYFSHMIISSSSTEYPSQNTVVASLLSPRKRLDEATSPTEARDVFHEMFCQKIEAMMKVPVDCIQINAPLADLGLDSLLAVEIRTWLLKKIGVDIPLLGILGNDSVSSIAAQVLATLFGGSSKAIEGQTPKEDMKSKDVDSMTDLHVDKNITTNSSEVFDSDSASLHITISPPYTPCTGSTEPSEQSGSLKSVCQESEGDPPDHLSSKLLQLNLAPKQHYDSEVLPQIIRTEPMSHQQASMHFLLSFLNDPVAFNVTAQFRISGYLNVNNFSKAIKTTLDLHEAYRTCFWVDPASLQLCQGISTSVNEDHYMHIHSSDEEEIQRTFEAFNTHKYDILTGKTFKVELISHSTTSHTVIFGCHHIIMDGMSWHIFFRDLDRAYRMHRLDASNESYLEFARQQVSDLETGVLDESIAYWIHHLTPIPQPIPLLAIAKSKVRKPRQTHSNYTARREVGLENVQQMKQVSKMTGTTTMHFYLAVLAGLFARLLDLEEICIGITDAGRSDYTETIGHFTNLLPIRLRTDREKSFRDLLRTTSSTVLNGINHSRVPIDVLMERLGVQRSQIGAHLFQIAFNYRIGDLLQRRLGDCSMEMVQYQDAMTPYDLTFTVTQTAGGHLLEATSNDSLYSARATETILDTFISALQSLSVEQSPPLKNCHFYRKSQLNEALALGQGQRFQYSWPATLTDRFRQVRNTFPNSVAIKDDYNAMTYDQFARRINAVTLALLEAGVNPGTHVAVLCEPSIDTYAAMLGILFAGAVYIPLDLSLPAARQRMLIEMCEPHLLICHDATNDIADQLDRHGSGIPKLNLFDISDAADDTPNISPGDYDFLLFTSGSTGRPKGVKLTQYGIMNYAAAKKDALGLGQVKVLQQSSTGFDMSLAQVFNAFANAGTLVIASQQCRGDPLKVAELMLQESINFTICTPTEYLMLTTYATDSLRFCGSWKYACSGGEAITDHLLHELLQLELSNLNVIDCYGPTEASCAVTFRQIALKAGDLTSDALHNVGKAIPNTFIYISGQDGKSLPIGFPGEVCIGGRGIAKGYLGAEPNSEKFIQNSPVLIENASEDCGFVYKTGDRGCLRKDGSLILLGRIDGDTLIKLRGLRIELNEVANSLLQAAKGALADAIVTVRGTPEFLVAHVVIARGEELSQQHLEHLCASLSLPRYMIPSMIVPLDRIPLTTNGKIDRKAVIALPLPEKAQCQEKRSRDRLTVAEGELCLIWRDVLGEAAGSIGIESDTDFFSVGGSSLLLVRLQGSLKEKMGVCIELRELYQASTLRVMANAITSERSQLAPDTIDWAEETSIPDSILSLSKNIPPSKPRKGRFHVALTGAVGFLGSEILSALIEQTDVAEIHCIAVPPDSRHNLPSHPKVVAHCGSLSSPNLGLSKSEMAFIQENIDQVIHAGAQGHCLNNYFSVRRANYLSTRFLAEISLPRKIPFHLISSPRVILQSGSVAMPPVSMSTYPPPVDGSQGFTASKWASEVFLENLARKTGLPVVIHRPCSLIGASAPHDDAMNSVIKYSVLSHTVPDVTNAEGFFDFKEVSEVADEIVKGLIADHSVLFRHYSSEVRVPWSGLAKRMEELHGGTFATVSMNEWIQKAVKLGIEELIVSYIEANVVGAAKLVFPYMGR